eukprot:TRINITY_DN13513_c0_g1_i2.p2 TRINITY_DN13513_c0_g1~~TRINITY_DN13513_c0_g1_i2.p2  ORF type:complete len:248 (+),score=28.64 TRINITY_DN13513_c0_g1_i2:743-1486(+)
MQPSATASLRCSRSRSTAETTEVCLCTIPVSFRLGPMLRPEAHGTSTRSVLKEFSTELVTLWLVYTVERGRQLCQALGVDRWTAVVDLAEVPGMTTFFGPTGKLFREQMKHFSVLYPEVMRYNLMINPPGSFNQLWKLGKKVVDKRTADKCRIGASLTEFINSDQILKCFGGTAPHSMSDVLLLPSTDAPMEFWRKRGYNLTPEGRAASLLAAGADDCAASAGAQSPRVGHMAAASPDSPLSPDSPK